MPAVRSPPVRNQAASPDEPPTRRWALAAALALLPVALGACLPPPTVLPSPGPGVPTWVVAAVTAEPHAGYRYEPTETAMRVTGLASDTAGGTRHLFWRHALPAFRDGQSCATWADERGSMVQFGAALRIRNDDGRIRAVTVTRNIVFGAKWGFNLHTWDTARAGRAYEAVGGVFVEDLRVGDLGHVPLPWRVCVKAEGARVTFKVWPLTEPDPGWGDPRRGGTFELPAGWAFEGKAGFYVGHLEEGGHALFTDLATRSLTAA